MICADEKHVEWGYGGEDCDMCAWYHVFRTCTVPALKRFAAARKRPEKE